ncbi:MAG TPA: MMPL family transporter [Gaiellaceae bacterium]|nr:MMPL family transporter [Gaiellaceae bacterium]
MTANSSKGDTPMPAQNLAGRAGRFSADHWKTAVFGWLALVVVAVVAGGAAGTVKQKDSDSATGETAKAVQILDRAGFQTPAGESVLVQSKTLTAADPAFRAVVADTIGRLSRQQDVRRIESPFAPGRAGQISHDGRSALIQFDIAGEEEKAADKVEPIMAAVAAVQKANPSFFVGEFGYGSANHELNDTLGKDFQRAEMTSLPVTLLILLIAFGALVAAGVPVLLAFSGVLATTGLAQVASHVVPASDSTQSVILLIGMAVGVDYSLFYIRREREERAKGLSHRDALLKTASTSGQAVLISGLTVMIAMAGMLFTGSKIFTSIAVGSMLMVAIALIGSLSVLPALMSKLGDRVNKGRIPLLSRLQSRSSEPRAWAFVLDRVVRRPLASALIAGGLLVALALPTFTLHTQLPSFTDLPKSIGIVATYDRIQAAFPGAQTPAEVVVRAADVTAPSVQRAIEGLERHALATGEMTQPIQTRINPSRTVEVVSIPLQGDGNDDASKQALETLRGEVVPATVGGLAGAEVAVSGQTAGTSDFNETMKSHMPIVFGFVLLLVFLLLLVTFRSLVVAAKAVVLNLLSVGAAYGILVAIFQHRWAEGLLGFHSNGAIATWLPLFLFVILFGLSMDYHVFILSRVKELVDDGMETGEAVAEGIKSTASTVTSAAIVMVAVFAIFGTLHTLDMKQMGVGLAVAILIDATLIRAVLLPATMKLLGDWNWYLPRWLEWLPSLSHEAKDEAAAEQELALSA